MARKVAVAAMDAKEAEEVMRRNAELEAAAAEAAAREERLRRELEAALAALAVAEEAEERLCVQLGELEAEAMAQAVEYQQQVRELSDRLAFADGVLRFPKAKAIIAESKQRQDLFVDFGCLAKARLGLRLKLERYSFSLLN
ncbi:hypothetical protein OsI_34275 [Oryza sativa Indica Group]|uniref:Uncharacterized protein n=1 Tax=Oryza sativa subsp. indica TaxID=39946 RepID=A2Z983_ORYSI|nr:hypothetical protein OsI_34275 [Oryza sativa Indica Group]